MSKIVVELGKELKIPGADGKWFDFRPHLTNLVNTLYERGYVLATLHEGESSTKIAEILSTGKSAKVGK
jgi:hypothetical protein